MRKNLERNNATQQQRRLQQEKIELTRLKSFRSVIDQRREKYPDQ